MNTDHLIYILEAYKCGSVNQAAKNCYISQSNLSSIIKNVENEIGFPIFYRKKSGIIATPAGERFMLSAERIINERQMIQRIPEGLSDNNSLELIVARAAFFSSCFFDFCCAYPCPDAHDSFLGAGVVENIRGIVAHQGRIGVLSMFESRIENYRQVAEQYALDFSVLCDNISPCIAVSKRHPLAKKKTLEKNDLRKHAFVVDAHITPEDTLEILGIHDRNKILQVSDLGMTYDAIRSGLYFSIGLRIPDPEAKMMGCICRSIPDLEKLAVCLIKNHYQPLNQRELLFVDYLRQRLDEVFS